MLDHLIVDGYNVLYAWTRQSGRSSRAPDAIALARETFLRELETAAAQRGLRCTVVFDGRPIEDVAHASSAHLEVLFAGPRQSADAVIERLVCQSQSKGRREKGLSPPGDCPFSQSIVVTNDRTVGNLVTGWGAHCWSSTMFRRWLDEDMA